ncbi:MAG: helix-turn-helix transcriptional regulator [Anaerovoracaceae bacterium]
MDIATLGERIKSLRFTMGKSQKEFAEFLGIPQPSMSAYENGKNSPTIDVVMDIAEKCNVSMDWLCGRDEKKQLASLSDVADFLYQLLCETNEIGCEIEVHDHLHNGMDIETPENRWYTQLKFYGNDPYSFNGDLCGIIRKIKEANEDIISYSSTPESYDLEKKSVVDYYSLPLTKKKIPGLSRDERLKKHIEYLKEHDNF